MTLKRHYDTRVNSFKQREEELLAEARSNRPKYKAPKSAEELDAFKKNIQMFIMLLNLLLTFELQKS